MTTALAQATARQYNSFYKEVHQDLINKNVHYNNAEDDLCLDR